MQGAKGRGFLSDESNVVDRRYLYSGSANATHKSVFTEELCFRITGPVAGQVLEVLAAQRVKRKPWDGA